jgi:hypothetical protein
VLVSGLDGHVIAQVLRVDFIVDAHVITHVIGREVGDARDDRAGWLP